MDEYAEYREDRHKSYTEQRRRLDDKALSITARYDQWLLTISGGALFVSLTFIEKISPSPEKWTIWILVLSWACLALALLLGFLAIHNSTRGLSAQVTILDREWDHFNETTSPENPEGTQYTPEENPFPSKIRNYNLWSLRLLIGGCAALVLFSSINLFYSNDQKGETMSEDKQAKVSAANSYTPPRNEAPRPRPISKPLTESYIPTTNEAPPPPPPKKN